MAHRVEIAASGRASCRGCKKPIAKGTPRFAEETLNQFSDEGGMTYRYWHLPCAATKMANEVGAALAAFDGAVDDRPAIDALVAEHWRPESPYAERASTGRARCRACDETIKKGELRVAFERVFESPMGPQKGAAYAHPRCVGTYLDHERERGREAPDREETIRLIAAHSKLPVADLEEAVGTIRGQ
jgi:poly [ADP-ribose] polymerase